MYVRKLGLRDFRSWQSVDIELEPGATVFVGRNGFGKTNLLEALGMLGAAIDTLDAARLKERGVRPAPLELYKSSFHLPPARRPRIRASAWVWPSGETRLTAQSTLGWLAAKAT